MSDKDEMQLRFDGGMINPELLELRREARDTWELTHEEAAEEFPESMPLPEVRKWLKVVALDVAEELEYDDIEEPGVIEWLVYEGVEDADELLELAPLCEAFEAPIEVYRACNPVEEWSRLDPTNVEYVSCAVCGETLYRVEHEESCWMCGDTACYVDDSGEVLHGEYVEDPGGRYYNVEEDGSYVMCGYCEESFMDYANTLVIHDGTHKYVVDYQGPVRADRGEYDSSLGYLGESGYEELVDEFVKGTKTVRVGGWRSYEEGPEETVEFTHLKAGWHSTMDKTSSSDAVNALTNGEFHRELGWEFPVVVMYGRTSNVFSVGLDIYVPKDKADEIHEELSELDGTGLDHDIGDV